ncbi:MAG: NADH-quinone oxidoreductase subunit NuoB [Planctomycetes bacterium]|nr:NADH-quinone oxidoreductase subunit NuoB [Planctomycetota bacterium]
MLKVLMARLQQGHRTSDYPAQQPTLPDRFRGLPVLDPTKCPDGCHACADACPTQAILIHDGGKKDQPPVPSDERGGVRRPSDESIAIDLGRCLFCSNCTDTCPEGAIQYTPEYRLATRTREDLILNSQAGAAVNLARALDDRTRRLFGRSLKLRQVSAGGCNACEADVNVLNTVVFDLGRFGIQFVASPRHADGLLITGPVSENMKLALKKTYEAVPPPKLVIAVGACAISGGPYIDHPEVHNGADSVVPVNLYVPGCPPHPLTILDGLLRLLGRLEDCG